MITLAPSLIHSPTYIVQQQALGLNFLFVRQLWTRQGEGGRSRGGLEWGQSFKATYRARFTVHDKAFIFLYNLDDIIYRWEHQVGATAIGRVPVCCSAPEGCLRKVEKKASKASKGRFLHIQLFGRHRERSTVK